MNLLSGIQSDQLFPLACAVSFVLSVVISGLLTWSVRNLAVARGWVRGPSSTRHIHRVALPRIGGVAVYLSFVLGFLLLEVTVRLHPAGTDLAGWGRTIGRILIPGTFLFVAGLVDDLRGLKAHVKLLCEIAAGMALYYLDFRVLDFDRYLAGVPGERLIALVVTVGWVIFIVNAINLLDGIDGLAAGSVLFSVFVIALVSTVFHNYLVAAAAVLLAGVVLGFLRFNFNPASIFLGDSGSLFLGFMVAGLSLAGIQTKATTTFAIAIPVVACGLPVMETAISIVRRFLSGRPLFRPDREHIHHRLLDMGLTQRQAVVYLYTASLLFAACSLLLLDPKRSSVAVVVVVFGGIVFVGLQRLRYPEFEEFGRIAIRTLEQRHVIANDIALRKAAERLRTAADLPAIRSVLAETFCGTEFDGFSLELEPGLRLRSETSRLSLMTCDRKYALTISLPLCVTEKTRLGVLHIYRSAPRKTLLLDVNLLGSELIPSITDALTRLSQVDTAVPMMKVTRLAGGATKPEQASVPQGVAMASSKELPDLRTASRNTPTDAAND